MVVNNRHIKGIVSRIRKFRMEVNKSASSGLANTLEADVVRLESYMFALKKYIELAIATPVPDNPKANPREYDLGERDELLIPANDVTIDLMDMLEIMEDEIAYSQSTRQSAGLIIHDSTRILAEVARVVVFLKDYAAVVQPLDLPESMPIRGVTGQGRGSAQGSK